MTTPVAAAVIAFGIAGAMMATGGPVRAQVPSVAPGGPAPAPSFPNEVSGPAAVGPTGGRVGAAEAPIVGGNIASARERALADAMKQAVDQALGTLIPDARTTQAKLVVQVLGRARSYVRRYRTLEEGERGRGLYGVRIEAEIDEAALLRAFDKPVAGPVTAVGATSASPPSYLLVGAGAPDALEAATRALIAAGARVQAARPDLTEPSKAVDAATRAGIAAVSFISGSVTSDGKVRGPGLEAVSCSIGMRVLTSGTGQPIADENESVRGFADRSESARADCFQRAAAALVRRIVPAAASSVTPDMRTIILMAALSQPAAVPALVKHLRAIGSVSAIEVRRITAGGVELWVRSRLPATAFASALGRDVNGSLVVSAPEVTGDMVRVTVAFREAAPASPVPPGPPQTKPPQP